MGEVVSYRDRVIVCGSRKAPSEVVQWQIHERLCLLPPGTVIVHGDGTGVDACAAKLASELGLEVEAHPADWERYGKAAGPRRNAEMAAAGADLCIAFRRDAGRGTHDMVRRCETAGIPVEWCGW